jgi:hypothetical protein
MPKGADAFGQQNSEKRLTGVGRDRPSVDMQGQSFPTTVGSDS